LPFCISVTNTIYVIEIEMLEPVFMARYHNLGTSQIVVISIRYQRISIR